MREIKFRAYIKNLGLMLPVSMIDFENETIYVRWNSDAWLNDPLEYDFDDKDIEIMQYTGLKDKNGKEIYEGDILLSTASENEEDYKKWRVSYFDGGYIANYKHIPMDKRKRSINEIELLCNDNIAFYGFEILGNIYENPELMEVDE